MNKNVLTSVCIIIGVVIILISFFLPWYNTKVVSGGVELGSSLYLDRGEMDIIGGQKIIQSNQGVDFLNNTLYLTIATFILSVLALIGVIGFFYNLSNRNIMKK